MLYSRDPVTGHAVMANGHVLTTRPPIPPPGRFLHAYGYETPTEILGYDWGTTFGRWGAYVTFADGWSGFTYPEIVSPPRFDYADNGNLAWLACPKLSESGDVLAVNRIVADPHPDDPDAVAVQTAPGTITKMRRCVALWYVCRVPPDVQPGDRWPADMDEKNG